MQLQTQLQTQIRHPPQLQQLFFPTAELGYGQLPVAPSPNDPTCFQRGLQTVQDLAWKNKP
ncbi:hypothetical protein CRYUN_Cryun10bG0006200 [Craigia yunnanensis]